MRIVFDGRFIQDGFPGIGRYAYNLVRGLGRLDFGDELFILANPSLPNHRFSLQALSALPGVRLVDCRVPRCFPQEMLRLPSLARGLRPDVFHSPFFLRPYPLPCPAVVTLHDLIPLQKESGGRDPIERALFRLGAGMACRYSAAVITSSASSAALIRRWRPEVSPRLHTIPAAPDLVFSRRPPQEVERVRRKWGLLGPYVLHVGSRKPHKNLGLLLESWALLGPPRRNTPPHRLVMAGPGERRDAALRKQARRLGVEARLLFLVEADEDDLPALYSGADLFVFPSLIEGYGLPVIEAMACGTPVICSDIPALKETAGDAAWFVDPRNPEALAAALVHFLEDSERRKAFAEKGLARVSALCWDDTAKATRDVYTKATQR